MCPHLRYHVTCQVCHSLPFSALPPALSLSLSPAFALLSSSWAAGCSFPACRSGSVKPRPLRQFARTPMRQQKGPAEKWEQKWNLEWSAFTFTLRGGKKSTHRNAVLLACVRHLALVAPTCSDPCGPALSWWQAVTESVGGRAKPGHLS